MDCPAFTVWRGDPFSDGLVFAKPESVTLGGTPKHWVPDPIPTGAIVTAKVGTATGAQIDDLTVTVGDQVASPGVVTVSADDTSEWPLGPLAYQLCIEIDGIQRHQQFIYFTVREPIK